MKAVITGAGGHIGFNVAVNLLKRGYSLIALARSESENLVKLKNSGAVISYVDLFNPSTYFSFLENADVLFHIAAENTTQTEDPDRVIRNTFELSKIVLDTALKAKVKTIVYTSSVVVLGRSLSEAELYDENNCNGFAESPYVKGKMLAEKYCLQLNQTSDSDIRIVYPSWVVGQGDLKGTPPHKIIMKYLNGGERFTFKGGISVADVEDVAEGHVNAWLLGSKQGRYLLAGQNITFRQFYETLASRCKRQGQFYSIPKWCIVAGSYVLRFLLGKKNPIDPAYAKSVIGRFSWYNSQKAVNEINYKIKSVDQIIDAGVLQAASINQQTNKLFDKKNDVVPSVYNDQDILLITGFPGWLSNRMVDVMINGDHFGRNKITRKVRLFVEPGRFVKHELPSNFELFYGNLGDMPSLTKALSKVKCVYHLAGVIYPARISSFYQVNTQGTINLVDACIESGVKRFIFTSTDSVCGFSENRDGFSENEPPRPYKNYGKSKYLAEEYVLKQTKAGKLDGSILRGFWFFGPFTPVRNMGFYRMMKWNRQILFGNGKNKRTITHIDNLIDAFVKVEKKSNTFGKWYWIGDGSNEVTVNDIYKNITSGLGVKFNPLYIPNWCCDCFGLIDTILGKFGHLNPTVHAAGKFHLNISARSDRAANDFGYVPLAGFEQISSEIKKLDL